MPNWCQNQARFAHEDEIMMTRLDEAFLRDGDKGVFQEFVPYTAGEEWSHQWCTENWGTKWEPTSIVGGDGFYTFDSAWSPPTGFYEKMVDLGFDIDAYYFEPGCGVCGKWVDGEDNTYWTDSRAGRADIPEDIAEFCHGGDGWAIIYDEASDEEEDEEKHMRRARYKGGAVALAAYRDLEAMGAC